MKKHNYLFQRSIAKSLLAALATCCLPTNAQQSAQSAEFVARESGSSAWVNRVFPEGGEYVYTAQGADGQAYSDRQTTRAFALNQVPRQNFDFFSIQEEEALWLVREAQLTTMHVKATQTGAKQRHTRRKKLHINWPKVIVENAQVCVPRVENSDASDWREHLLCWAMATHDDKKGGHHE